MFHILTEGGNSELRNRTFPIPKGVYQRLVSTLHQYTGDKTVNGYKRLNNLIGMKTVSYQEMKRLKNYFDQFKSNPGTEEYMLNGGDAMKLWVNNALNTATTAVRDFKQRKKDAGLSNAFIRPHEKEREKTSTNHPTMSKMRTNNVNRAVGDGEAIKFESVKRQNMKRVIILSEAQEQMLRGSQGSSFSLDELTTIKSFRGKVRYCNEHLGEPIGKGSSRVVYGFGDGKVLKLAYNPKGIAQNSVEYDRLLLQMDLIPKVYEVEDDYAWIVAEHAEPVRSLDFKQCVGLKWREWCKFIQTCTSIKNRNYDKWGTYVYSMDEFYDMVDNDESGTLNAMLNYITCYDVDDYDLARVCNYGKVKRGGRDKIVLVDAGLNETVWNDYYERKTK